MSLLRFVAIAALLATSAPCLAARLAPLPPSSDAPMTGELRDRFHDALTRGLSQAQTSGLDVLGASEVRSRLAGGNLAGCRGGSCLPALADGLKVDRVASVEVQSTGKNYVFTLTLYDQTGADLWHATERCDICTVREADQALERAASRMAPFAARPTPREEQAKAAAAAAEKAAAAEVKAPVPLIPQAPVDSAKAQSYRTGKLVALIVGSTVGGGLIVASIPFWVFSGRDGQLTCGSTTPSRECATIYQGNLPAALGLMISGVVVAGAGVGAFAALHTLEKRERRKAAAGVSLLPLPGGGLLSLQGRF